MIDVKNRTSLRWPVKQLSSLRTCLQLYFHVKIQKKRQMRCCNVIPTFESFWIKERAWIRKAPAWGLTTHPRLKVVPGTCALCSCASIKHWKTARNWENVRRDKRKRNGSWENIWSWLGRASMRQTNPKFYYPERISGVQTCSVFRCFNSWLFQSQPVSTSLDFLSVGAILCYRLYYCKLPTQQPIGICSNFLTIHIVSFQECLNSRLPESSI